MSVSAETEPINILKWRSIGPYRGGRVVAVAGDPVNKQTFYFGACAGGVWKTLDGGIYWENISDGFFGSSSIGAIDVAQSDPSVIYVGTGEACIRSNVSHGDGVYRSTNGGKDWVNIGLEDTRHISRIRVHPNNPDHLYVAAFGHAFGRNKQRGIFRSTDGGQSWEHILFKSDKSGAIDLSMDPNNPRILYAAIWQALRTPWSLEGAGPESGLWKSTNGGDTWIDLSENTGMPSGIKGRIGVAVSPAKPDRVWAIVESQDGGLLLSDDGGNSWERVNDSSIVKQRPFYHHHIFAHPKDANTMWTLPIQAWKSNDQGRSFTMVTTPHSDNHDLWIDPNDPDRMIEGNDGGACVSFNGGDTWSSIYNQPTAQFYHLTTDNSHPYRVLGTQQDNSAISTPSRNNEGAITSGDTYTVGSSESGHIAVHPENTNIVYSGAIGSAPGGGGALLRYNRATKESRIITVWPEISYGLGARDMKYRFQWTFPIVISPHDPDVLYVAGNHLFKSTDEGTSWQILSPDLTRNDPAKGEPGGGPISRDVSGAEVYCTIFSFSESHIQKGLFWAGSDDGLVHISSDNGQSWQEVTPPGMPEWATVSMIEPSHHDKNTAYVSAWNYKLDDYSPYIYKTIDKGKSWTPIIKGIPDGEFIRVIREDPLKSGLLFVGTETGVYFSMDSGTNWNSFQLNLPNVPVHDLIIKNGDLIAGTHGRSFWIMDDLSVLRQLGDDNISSKLHLFEPRPTYRKLSNFGEIPDMRVGAGKNYWVNLGTFATWVKPNNELQTDPINPSENSPEIEDRPSRSDLANRQFLDAGENPSDGLVVNYKIGDISKSDSSLTFSTNAGEQIIKFTDVSKNLGTNQFIWDMRYPGPTTAAGDESQNLIPGPNPKGPMVLPGHYQVSITVHGITKTRQFHILQDPRSEASSTDLEKQFDLLIEIRDEISQTNGAINKLRGIRPQIQSWISRKDLSDKDQRLVQTGTSIINRLNDIESALISSWNTTERGQMGTPLPKLVDALATLVTVVESADWVPTDSSYEVLESVSSTITHYINTLQNIIDNDVAMFNTSLTQLQLRPIVQIF
ncbi:MAG: glycosyl hydrolase [Chloroflexota bacterium]|nr:glycosyl hydrolase [Chloroflexota bacterium]